MAEKKNILTYEGLKKLEDEFEDNNSTPSFDFFFTA